MSSNYDYCNYYDQMETVPPPFGQSIRKEFMFRENSVFLNHGAYGCVPRCVYNRRVR